MLWAHMPVAPQRRSRQLVDSSSLVAGEGRVGPRTVGLAAQPAILAVRERMTEGHALSERCVRRYGVEPPPCFGDLHDSPLIIPPEEGQPPMAVEKLDLSALGVAPSLLWNPPR